VEVAVDGVTLAASDRPVLLFETHLPTRYYLPVDDVRLDLLQPTDNVSYCPYKGRTDAYWTWPGPPALPNVACVGGSWITPKDAVDAGDWGQIETLAREAAHLRTSPELA
jgi:hypothetical protein